MQISGKTFLVTGGASGLGRASAEAILAAGGNVVILDVNAETGRAAEQAMGAKARFSQTDVTSEEQVKAAVDLAASAFGGLHGVVNAAGIGPAAKVLGRNGPHPLDLFEKTIKVNLIGTFNVIRLAAAVISQNQPDVTADGSEAKQGFERGVIINTASIAAFDGQIGQPAYAASKGGIVGMTLPIAREFAPLGIRVVTIAPGIFDTPLLAGLPEPARVSLGQQVPFPSRLGRPAEYGALVRHILENEMLNGEVIRLDGALRMAPK
jgi:NAD(P)-dependent dehydrogenase (short-subunit alcohol dehydrogenase family)